MKYRHDPDLEFLGTCSSEELDQLVHILTYDKNGNPRFTEKLTTSDDYKLYFPDHQKYWRNIAAEIQFFGSNTVASTFRGGYGVLYKEVLCDVCDKLKVNYNKFSSTQLIEDNLLMKILTKALEDMSPEELQNLANELDIPNACTSKALTATFIAVFRAGGFKSYQLTVIIANAVLKMLINRGLPFAANAALTKVASILTGPIGWAITGIWTALDIAGPAYRVTIPTVIEIAYLRKYAENREAIERAKLINF